MRYKIDYVIDVSFSYDGIAYYSLDPFEDLNIEGVVILDIDSLRIMEKIKSLFKENLYPVKLIKKILHRIRSNTFDGG